MQFDVRLTWDQFNEGIFSFTTAVISQLLHLKRVRIGEEKKMSIHSAAIFLSSKSVTVNNEWLHKPHTWSHPTTELTRRLIVKVCPLAGVTQENRRETRKTRPLGGKNLVPMNRSGPRRCWPMASCPCVREPCALLPCKDFSVSCDHEGFKKI